MVEQWSLSQGLQVRVLYRVNRPVVTIGRTSALQQNVAGSSPAGSRALLAQLIEQWSSKPKVVGLNPSESNTPLAQLIERWFPKP